MDTGDKDEIAKRHLAGPDCLGFSFQYPPEYIECIGWADRDVEAGGDGHALSFLTVSEIPAELEFFVRKATRWPLVPFARGDNGDALFCFDGGDTQSIYVIDLGSIPLKAIDTGCSDFLDFLSSYRRNMGLPEWRPPT